MARIRSTCRTLADATGPPEATRGHPPLTGTTALRGRTIALASAPILGIPCAAGGTADRDRSIMRRLAGILLPLSLLPALALPLSAAADPLPSPGVCPASGPQVCFVDASETPQVTIPAGSSDMTYLHVRATVLNRGTSTATHLSITEAPPPGLAVAALSGVDGAGRPAVCLPLTGACSYSTLQAGRSVTIDAVLAVSAAARPTTAG